MTQQFQIKVIVQIPDSSLAVCRMFALVKLFFEFLQYFLFCDIWDIIYLHGTRLWQRPLPLCSIINCIIFDGPRHFRLQGFTIE